MLPTRFTRAGSFAYMGAVSASAPGEPRVEGVEARRDVEPVFLGPQELPFGADDVPVPVHGDDGVRVHPHREHVQPAVAAVDEALLLQLIVDEAVGALPPAAA